MKKTDNVAKLESRIDLLSIIGEVEGHEALGGADQNHPV